MLAFFPLNLHGLLLYYAQGQGIYAYVTLMLGCEPSETVRSELIAAVRRDIGAFAAPDVIHWVRYLGDARSTSFSWVQRLIAICL